jgi:hypothetical protein
MYMNIKIYIMNIWWVGNYLTCCLLTFINVTLHVTDIVHVGIKRLFPLNSGTICCVSTSVIDWPLLIRVYPSLGLGMLVVEMGTNSFQNGINIVLGYVVGSFVVHWTIWCEPPKSFLGYSVLVIIWIRIECLFVSIFNNHHHLFLIKYMFCRSWNSHYWYPITFDYTS